MENPERETSMTHILAAPAPSPMGDHAAAQDEMTLMPASISAPDHRPMAQADGPGGGADSGGASRPIAMDHGPRARFAGVSPAQGAAHAVARAAHSVIDAQAQAAQ
jgi:hypothetical protein